MQVTCRNADHQDQRLLAYSSSCRNLDVLPVSTQTSTSPVLVIVISVAVVILLLASVVITTIIFRIIVKQKVSRPHLTTYLHYSMADDTYVRQHVAPRVTSRVLYHHGDLSTQLSVGQAIANVVTSSDCLVIVATASYIDSTISNTELHILADCILHKWSVYPVIVLVPDHTSYSLHQVTHRHNIVLIPNN